MNNLILGSTGFIGTNLAINLSKEYESLKLVGKKITKEFMNLFDSSLCNISYIEDIINIDTDFDTLTSNIDTVYHLICSCFPANSNDNIEKNIVSDLQLTIRLLDSMVRNKCNKIVFISSGGAIYGNMTEDDINELSFTSPITAYGIQKLTIEKVIYLYHYLFGIDYRIVRLGNPYGKFQKANVGLGIIPTLVDKAINDKIFNVYGNGTNERDYIFIDDAIEAINNITNIDTKYKLYNVGSGIGTSINELIKIVSNILNKKININYIESRSSDVKNIYLNISRYTNEFGNPAKTSLYDGIKKTIQYMQGIRNL